VDEQQEVPLVDCGHLRLRENCGRRNQAIEPSAAPPASFVEQFGRQDRLLLAEGTIRDCKRRERGSLQQV